MDRKFRKELLHRKKSAEYKKKRKLTPRKLYKIERSTNSEKVRKNFRIELKIKILLAYFIVYTIIVNIGDIFGFDIYMRLGQLLLYNLYILYVVPLIELAYHMMIRKISVKEVVKRYVPYYVLLLLGNLFISTTLHPLSGSHPTAVIFGDMIQQGGKATLVLASILSTITAVYGYQKIVEKEISIKENIYYIIQTVITVIFFWNIFNLSINNFLFLYNFDGILEAIKSGKEQSIINYMFTGTRYTLLLIILTCLSTLVFQIYVYIRSMNVTITYVWKKCGKDILNILYGSVLLTMFTLVSGEYHRDYLISILLVVSGVIKYFLNEVDRFNFFEVLSELMKVFIIIFIIGMIQPNWYLKYYVGDAVESVWILAIETIEMMLIITIEYIKANRASLSEYFNWREILKDRWQTYLDICLGIVIISIQDKQYVVMYIVWWICVWIVVRHYKKNSEYFSLNTHIFVEILKYTIYFLFMLCILDIKNLQVVFESSMQTIVYFFVIPFWGIKVTRTIW